MNIWMDFKFIDRLCNLCRIHEIVKFSPYQVNYFLLMLELKFFDKIDGGSHSPKFNRNKQF